MMRRIHILSLIQLLVVLPACTSGQPATTQVPIAGAEPGAAPAASDAATPAPALTPVETRIAGTARLFDQAFADAKVSLYALGGDTELATATTGADGAFAIAVPAGQPAGTVYKVVVRRGDEGLMSLYHLDESAAYRTQATAPLAVTLDSTTAFALLSQRLEVAGSVQTAAKLGKAIFASFVQLTSSQAGLLTAQSPATLVSAIMKAIDAKGRVTLTSTTATAIGRLASPAQQQAFLAVTAQLTSALREAATTDKGIEVALKSLGSVSFGNVTAPSVISNGGSGGGNATPTPSPTPTPTPTPSPTPTPIGGSVGVTLVPGAFATPGAALTGQRLAGPGVILARHTVAFDIGHVTVDPAGNAWIIDFWNNKVRRVSPTGVATTFATGMWPLDIQFDAAGTAWVVCQTTSTATRITTADVVDEVQTYAGSTFAVAPDSEGGAWYAGGWGGLYHVDAAGELLVRLPVDGGREIRLVPGGGLWVRQDSGVSFVSAAGEVTPHSISNPPSMKVDASGNAWVISPNTNQVIRISTAGVVTPFPTGALPQDVDVDAQGNAWVCGLYDNLVTRISASDAVTTIDIGNSYNHAIAVDANGTAWVTNFYGNSVTRIEPSGSFTTIPAGRETTYMNLDAQGNAWVVSRATKSILLLAK